MNITNFGEFLKNVFFAGKTGIQYSLIVLFSAIFFGIALLGGLNISELQVASIGECLGVTCILGIVSFFFIAKQEEDIKTSIFSARLGISGLIIGFSLLVASKILILREITFLPGVIISMLSSIPTGVSYGFYCDERKRENLKEEAKELLQNQKGGLSQRFIVEIHETEDSQIFVELWKYIGDDYRIRFTAKSKGTNLQLWSIGIFPRSDINNEYFPKTTKENITLEEIIEISEALEKGGEVCERIAQKYFEYVPENTKKQESERNTKDQKQSILKSRCEILTKRMEEMEVEL